ncbi:MAG: hypothetical protein D6722_13960 [Bacteroidetes bacterium]|nr:MAG: hypothetical protein D6722_13960 [Bacteroidota bacterium]
MKDKIFIIGIGGTGMRCLESFVHLAAMGMLDETEIEMLALDTDRDNGNFRRLADLVDTYQKCKGVEKQQYALSQTFFSAKINYYQYSPDYAKQETGNFVRITGYGDLKYQDEKQAQLADLLLTANTREFDLKHGYRAQTHLGSFLMYHNILEEVKTNHDGQLARFINALITANQSISPKVFVLGSVFGGTGASSIPVIPKAFNAAANVLAPGIGLRNVLFGSVLLTSYFTFQAPSGDYLARQRVVATAEKFALNSQAAMMFYNEDKTVKKTYQKFYMLGTPTMDFSTDIDSSEPLTGGGKQENNSHYIELFAAFAAYDFFHSSVDELTSIKNSAEGVKYFYRTVSADGTLDFGDFVDASTEAEFAKRFGMQTVMSHLVTLDDFFGAAQSGSMLRDNISGYEDIDVREVEAMQKYYQMFNFRVDNGQVRDGWLRQLYVSTGGGDKFMFRPEMFGATTERELRKFSYNNRLYKTDYEKNSFKTGLFGSPFNSFKEAFKGRADDPDVPNKCEKLTKRMYAALCDLYGFK